MLPDEVTADRQCCDYCTCADDWQRNAWFQAFNPFMIVGFTPLVVSLWTRQSRKGTEPNTVTKMALGLFMLAVSYLIMAGAAYLDTMTYALRYTTTWLTRPERSSLTGVRTVTFRTRFRDIARGVPLQDSLTAVTTYRFGKPTNIQTQRTVEVRFRRQPPPP